VLVAGRPGSGRPGCCRRSGCPGREPGRRHRRAHAGDALLPAAGRSDRRGRPLGRRRLPGHHPPPGQTHRTAPGHAGSQLPRRELADNHPFRRITRSWPLPAWRSRRRCATPSGPGSRRSRARAGRPWSGSPWSRPGPSCGWPRPCCPTWRCWSRPSGAGSWSPPSTGSGSGTSWPGGRSSSRSRPCGGSSITGGCWRRWCRRRRAVPAGPPRRRRRRRPGGGTLRRRGGDRGGQGRGAP